MAKLFSAATGMDIDEEGMTEIGDRIWALERAFIAREGITRKDDVLVGRLANEPMNGGQFDGVRINKTKWDKMLDEYYDLVGFDKKTGIPTRAKLESVGLKDVADELAILGKL
jgi:aldehyde:ferredoxin oxidoreductase